MNSVFNSKYKINFTFQFTKIKLIICYHEVKIKYLVFFFFFLISPISLVFSSELQSLNTFTKATQIFTFKVLLEENNIRASQDNVSKNEINDFHQSYVIGYGKKLPHNDFVMISLPFIKSEENGVKYNGDHSLVYHSKGFTEPTIAYFKRYKTPNKDNEYIKDFSVAFTPSLFEKKSGTIEANKATGGHILQLKGSSGALYKIWEARLISEFHYFFHNKDHNLKTNTTYTKTPFYQALFGIEIQYKYSDHWYFNTGSGIQIIQDAYTNSSEEEKDTLIQLGTGSVGYFGFTYRLRDDVYKMKVFRAKNDFFVEGTTSNFRGEYTKFLIAFDYLTEF